MTEPADPLLRALFVSDSVSRRSVVQMLSRSEEARDGPSAGGAWQHFVPPACVSDVNCVLQSTARLTGVSAGLYFGLMELPVWAGVSLGLNIGLACGLACKLAGTGGTLLRPALTPARSVSAGLKNGLADTGLASAKAAGRVQVAPVPLHACAATPSGCVPPAGSAFTAPPAGSAFTAPPADSAFTAPLAGSAFRVGQAGLPTLPAPA